MLLWKNSFYRRLHKITKAVFVLHFLPGCWHVKFTFGVSVGLGGFQNKVLQILFSNCLKHISYFIYVDLYSLAFGQLGQLKDFPGVSLKIL